jgi:hypothetical protein|tara:strand:+ start:1681 stop:2058 length:378 start_codon:yes stop_codon:yes gene_type:complete
MKYTIIDVLPLLKPNCEYNINGTDYSGLVWLDNSETQPTEKEINDKITELDNAEAMKLLRDERNQLISESDWMVVVSQETGVAISNEWKAYRQALRDLPATATPKLDTNFDLDLSSVTWPTKPDH